MIKVNLLNYRREIPKWQLESGDVREWYWGKIRHFDFTERFLDKIPSTQFLLEYFYDDVLKFGKGSGEELYISERDKNGKWERFVPHGEDRLSWHPLPVRIAGSHPIKVVDGEFVTDREREAILMEKGWI